ncbi:MAG: hypothetical protein EHM42_16050 [Planctomycetaceae bacterium]|nr:MAG: hypothetical protein EHM42_16050 [Planctomycetaceae bacterium]
MSAWPPIRQAQLEEQRARMMALELRLAAETARVAAEAERRAAQSIADDSLGKASPTPAGASAVLENPGEGADSVIKQPLPVEPAE